MLMAAIGEQYNEPFCSGVSCGLIQKAGAPDHVKQMDILWFNASVRVKTTVLSKPNQTNLGDTKPDAIPSQDPFTL